MATPNSDTAAGLNEIFCYDVLNRVKGSSGSCNTFNYDGAGNVTKPGVALAYKWGQTPLDKRKIMESDPIW